MLKRYLFGVLAAGAIFLGLFAIQGALLDQWRTIYEERERLSRIRQEMLRLERLVADVDNGFRGYVLMRQSVFLDPLIAAEGKIPSVLEGLSLLTEGLPVLDRGVQMLSKRVTELLVTKRDLLQDLGRGRESEVLAYIKGGEGLALAGTVALSFRDLEQKLDRRQRDREGPGAEGIQWVQWGLTLTALGGYVCGIGIGRAAGRATGPASHRREAADRSGPPGTSRERERQDVA